MASMHRGPVIRSDFGSVLDTLRRDQDAAIDAAEGADRRSAEHPPHANFDVLSALDGANPELAEAAACAASPADLYIDAGFEPEPDAPIPSLLTETSPDRGEIPSQPVDALGLARELGLRPGLDAKELTRLRRAFALKNHPDRLDPTLRDLATHRMTLANSLIDEAMQRIRLVG